MIIELTFTNVISTFSTGAEKAKLLCVSQYFTSPTSLWISFFCLVYYSLYQNGYNVLLGW